MTNMKILIRSHHSLDRANISGGAQRLMQNIATALDESGWDVDVLCPASSENQKFPVEGITFHEFQYSDPSNSVETFINMGRGLRKYRSIVTNSDYDVMLDDVSHYPYYPAHSFCPEETTNAVFLHLALFNYARKYNGFARGTVIDLIDRTLPYLNSPEIICAGESTQQRIHTHLDYQHTHILNPCIDVDLFEYNFTPTSNTILYLGRLGPRKNVKCLLRAWGLLEESIDDFTLVIAGKGSKEQELHELSRDLNLKNVDFRGYVSEEEKFELLSESLLYVLPSKMEGYVTSGLEALASGTPVVGSNTYGINDYISHKNTGYLYQTNNHSELANLLKTLISDPSQMRSVAESGYKLSSKHSYEEFRENTDTLFRKLAHL